MNLGIAEIHHFRWTFNELHWIYVGDSDIKVRMRYRDYCENREAIEHAVEITKEYNR